MTPPPQVVLFGSIYGGWREQVVIPLLQELGVNLHVAPDVAGVVAKLREIYVK